MGVVRHVEFSLVDKFTTWGESIEDFENDNAENIEWDLKNYLMDSIEDFIANVKVNSVWYEED